MLFTMAVLLLAACNQGQERFSTSGPEMDLVKKLVVDYEKGNWDEWTEAYADTAKIHYNTRTKHINADEAIASHRANLEGIGNYGFMDEPVFFEKVIDDKGKTWVNFWGYWHGTLKANNQKLETPVHLTMQVKEGKIVEEHGFWDNSPMILALQEIEAVKKAQMTEEEESE